MKAGHGGAGASGSSRTRPSTIVEKAKLAFNVYDRNRDGYLTKAELRKTSKRMTDAQIDAVFDKYDVNKDGKLDFNEFKNLMEARSKTQEEEERTLMHRNSNASKGSEKLQKQQSVEKGSSQPSSPEERLARNKLQKQNTIAVVRGASPRRKSSERVSDSLPKN